MDDSKIKSLVRESIVSRRKLALSMLANYAALKSAAISKTEDVEYWQRELAGCERELAEMDKTVKS